MSKHKRRAVLLTPTDKVIHIPRAEALAMLERGEAVMLYPDPLKLRLNQWPEYQREERRRRGRLIPGVAHPDPDRQCGHTKRSLAVFDRHCVQGPDQGRAFPLYDLTPEELEYRAYRREYIRAHSEEQLARTMARKVVAEEHNRRVHTSARRVG